MGRDLRVLRSMEGFGCWGKTEHDGAVVVGLGQRRVPFPIGDLHQAEIRADEEGV